MSEEVLNHDWSQLPEGMKDLMGVRVGSMQVIKLDSFREATKTSPSGKKEIAYYDKWLVQCDCGARSVKDGRNLRVAIANGKTPSCGHRCPFHPRRGKAAKKS